VHRSAGYASFRDGEGFLMNNKMLVFRESFSRHLLWNEKLTCEIVNKHMLLFLWKSDITQHPQLFLSFSQQVQFMRDFEVLCKRRIHHTASWVNGGRGGPNQMLS